MPRRDAVSRRRFVQGAAAALAAPLVVPGAVLGKDENTPPSDRTTVGFIGVGKMANDYHLSTLLRFGDVQAVAVCDVDTTRRMHARKRVEDAYGKREKKDYKGCDDTSDFREIIGRQDIDAVVIATPDHWHAIPIVEACKAGKDVYCEKPMTLTIAEAKLCIDAVRKYERVMQTGSQQRSSVFGPFRKAVELVRSGRLGELKTVEVGVGGPSRWCNLPEQEMEPGLDWPMWLGQAPTRPYNSVLSPRGVHNHFPAWRAFREYSGGSMTDIGTHHFDICQWGLGVDESGPVEVIPPEDPSKGRGVQLVYADGVVVTHGRPGGCVFTGTKGKLHINRGHLSSDPESIVKEPLRDDEVHLYKSPGHHRNWLDCIRSRERPVADVEIGARSVTVCHLGNLGYWYGRKLKWDPKNWCFDNAEDNKLMDRARRDPWQLPKI